MGKNVKQKIYFFARYDISLANVIAFIQGLNTFCGDFYSGISQR